MNELTYSKSYNEYKAEVGTELSKASESFVRIGYLLKVARDTDVLKGTEYESNYLGFAEGEFGLDKSQVSRFIRINDRFSVGGNSDELLPEFKGFGTRKLGIMIMLPDELTEELSPEYTVEEINEIKEVVKEEQAITPVEAMVERMSNPESEETPLIESCLYQILENNPDIFVDICKDNFQRTWKILAPVSEQMYIVRLQGIGRMMVTFHETEVSIFNARTSEKETVDKETVEKTVKSLVFPYSSDKEPETGYQVMFGKEFPKKEETKKEIKKESRVKDVSKKKPEKKPKEEKVARIEKAEEIITKAETKEEPKAAEPSITVEQIRAAVLNFYHFSYLDNILQHLDAGNVDKALIDLKTDIKRLNDVKDIMEQYKPEENE